MREIEVKAHVGDKTALMQALRAHDVTLSQPVKQHDVVFSRPGAKNNDPEENWLRIRTENDQRHIFTLKRSVTGDLDSIEHEIEVSNEKELQAIIGYLGYELFSDLTKFRQKGRVNDVEICLDDLPELGVFIEAERLCSDDIDGQAVQVELWELLESFGILRNDEETRGYDILHRRMSDNI